MVAENYNCSIYKDSFTVVLTKYFYLCDVNFIVDQANLNNVTAYYKTREIIGSYFIIRKTNVLNKFQRWFIREYKKLKSLSYIIVSL